MPTTWDYISSIPGFGYINGLCKDFLVSVLKTGPIPDHISYVMDGNRRFAKRGNLPLKEGHMKGAQALVEVLECCFRVGVKNVTVYAFSIENFSRSKAEVETIFDLLLSKLAYVSEDNDYCQAQQLRIKLIGNRALLPEKVLADIERIEERTAAYKEHTLFIAFPYTSRDDVVHSVRQICDNVKDGKLESTDIDEKTIENNFYYEGDAGKVDILVRTSGHTRLSDYMLWQCHQDSTIELPNTLWPDYRFYNAWWTIFKWSYYKTQQLEDAETMQISKLTRKDVDNRYKRRVGGLTHPPFASVTSS